jgi:hypothetical protein
MTQPDDIPVEGDDDEPGLDPSQVNAARKSDANEADLIEQATAVPVADDEFDR